MNTMNTRQNPILATAGFAIAGASLAGLIVWGFYLGWGFFSIAGAVSTVLLGAIGGGYAFVGHKELDNGSPSFRNKVAFLSTIIGVLALITVVKLGLERTTVENLNAAPIPPAIFWALLVVAASLALRSVRKGGDQQT